MSPQSGWLRAGRVGRPHGLDGAVYVSEPNRTLLEVGARVWAGERELRVIRASIGERRVVLWFDACHDRAAAEELRGQQLLAARGDAPELPPDEWWAEDLEGCSVHDGPRAVGTVKRMLSLPSCEVLEVNREPEGGELLVPLVSDAVRAVDICRREIDVDLGFLGEA